MRLKRRDLIIITVLIAMCLVTLVGSSYALFTRTFTSTKKISVQAGTLKVDFAEGDRINLSNVAPMSDNDGMNTTPYTFTITNSGSVAAYYTIRNEEDSSNTLNNKYIKYRLVSDSYDSGIKTLDTMGSGYYMLSSENTLAVGKSITYKLYLWLSSEAGNEAQNKTYQSKIVVQSTTNSISDTVATTLLKGVGDNGSIDASDPEQTFITGTDPNNYIWYSGKLWRAVSIDPSDNSVKLVTQWAISAAPYSDYDNHEFQKSYIREWLNDVSVDGFLGNLREPEKFIKTDSIWNATMTTDATKPEKTTLITNAVGLLNNYEYAKSYNGNDSYLNNGYGWWLLTDIDSTNLHSSVSLTGYLSTEAVRAGNGIRPSVNLLPSIKISSGTGTSDDPYRLENDSDNNLKNTLLSTRYSGEYINFGTGENNLYRIVSHENGTGTKIVSDLPLKENGDYKTISFGDNNSFNINNTLGNFLNTEYISNYITDEEKNMIEENTEWYFGSVWDRGIDYKLTKYDQNNQLLTESVTTAKVGILRYGELMCGRFYDSNKEFRYWTITPVIAGSISYVIFINNTYGSQTINTAGIKAAMNLKSNVVITGGDGTKSNPFSVALQ